MSVVHGMEQAQTISTVGYGGLSPSETGVYINIVVAAAGFFGFVAWALLSALLWSKFGDVPTQVLLSDKAVRSHSKAQCSDAARGGGGFADTPRS